MIQKYTYAIRSENPNFDESFFSVFSKDRKGADDQIKSFKDAMGITKATLKTTKPTNHKPKKQ